MEVRVHKFSQQGQEMYVTVLSGKTIAAISDVDSVDRDANGYQRERIQRRCNELKDFIEMTKGLVPGAILLNVRPEKVDELHFSKLGEQDGVEFGTVELPDGKFAWQIDGQHRVGAFEQLTGDILVPVVLTIGLGRAKEAETFNVINSKQKNVSASLRYYDLMRYAEEDVRRWAERGEKESRELAYKIVLDISQDALWKGRINVSGVRGMKRAINLKGFMDALNPVVKDRSFATLPGDRQFELMRTFWRATDKTWPIALAPGSTSILTKTFGAHVACGIAIDIFHYCEQLNDSSEGMMARLLEPIKGTVGDWDSDGPLASYIGGGRKNVTFVIDLLRAEIRRKFEQILERQPAQPA